jgi:starch synthase
MAKKRSDPKPSVLMIGSEAQPFAKTGGLADVLGALPSALARIGWDATVALPRYRGVAAGDLVESFPVTVGGFTCEARFFEAPLADGARALLIDCPELYDREALYGPPGGDYPDNPRRFAFLVRAALEFAGRRAAPTIVHAHDWQAGLAPVYLRTLYASHPVLARTASVFTIHNLAYQGLFEADWLPRLDLGWDQLTMDRLEYWGRISFLKGGLIDARFVTTVSKRYAEEIQTAEFGFGFDGIMRSRRAHLVGILNGVDTREWDPASDPHLPAHYDAAHLEGKRAAKKEVMTRYGLPTDAKALQRPLVGMVSRMVDQKGFDLIAALADDLPTLGASFVILGTGDARYQTMWTTLAAKYPDRIAARIGFDEALAHLIEAGSDIFLMPSRFEPCGLNQMYSMRYGTIPVVHAVGGLADTVVDEPKRPSRAKAAPAAKSAAPATSGSRPSKATGFVFREPTPEALLATLQRAIAAFGDRAGWQALQQTGMRQDFSWDRSAQEYVKMYRRAVAG